jgi:hypothetical protein
VQRPGWIEALFFSDGNCLPAIAAVSAIAAAPATAAMAATPTTAATAPAAVTTTTAPAATALCLGTRFIHHQVSPAKILPVQRIDRTVRIFVAVDLHEGETARLARETVTNQIDPRGRYPHLRKPLLKLFLRRRKRKITDIELLHLSLLLPGT